MENNKYIGKRVIIAKNTNANYEKKLEFTSGVIIDVKREYEDFIEDYKEITVYVVKTDDGNIYEAAWNRTYDIVSNMYNLNEKKEKESLLTCMEYKLFWAKEELNKVREKEKMLKKYINIHNKTIDEINSYFNTSDLENNTENEYVRTRKNSNKNT